MKRLNILLVKPFKDTNEVQPPLGLGYMASSLKGEHDVTILDSIKEGMGLPQFREYLKGKNFDIIGFQCYTADLNVVKEHSKVAREASPKSVILVGGPHPTLDPINTLKYLKNVDFAFVGEAEKSFPEFAKAVASGKKASAMGKIPGIAFRDGRIYRQTRRVFTENLDDYEPSWELFDMKGYPEAPHGAFCKQSPTAPLIITRGCPFQCTYCGGPLISGRKIRSHSVDYVIRQIKTLTKEYGIREIHIEDDNFTMRRDFVKEFCTRLIKLDLGITWTCPNGMRLDTLDDELVSLMKRSGLYSVSVGIESGSDRIRGFMKKNLKTAQIREKVKLIRRHGLGVIGFFIVGFPGETRADIEKTIDLALELDLKRATFSAFKPFPGTEEYNKLVKKGEIGELNWDNFSLDKVVWSPKGISMDELKKMRRRAFLKFYLRPKIFFRMLSEINSFENLKFIVVRMFRWMS